jgi:hypothetical protein
MHTMVAGGIAAMTARRPCPPAPGPLEDFSVQFDSLFFSFSQRDHFRTYLAGLLLPRDRPKTLTALAGAEPVVLQFFLSESAWDAEAINARRLELLAVDPATAPNAGGVLVIDDTGDRKDGCATDHVARQYLGSVGKIDNGIVAVTTLWADERCYYPLQGTPYTPERRLAGGKQDPAFHTKPHLALTLVARAQAAGIPFKAVVADGAYGDNPAREKALLARHLPHVLSRRGTVGRGRAPPEAAHAFEDAARNVPMSAWRKVVRRFRDGHAEHWWATELTLFRYGPDQAVRAICATTDRRMLPALTTWYLTTNFTVEQAPLSEPAATGSFVVADARGDANPRMRTRNQLSSCPILSGPYRPQRLTSRHRENFPRVRYEVRTGQSALQFSCPVRDRSWPNRVIREDLVRPQ